MNGSLMPQEDRSWKSPTALSYYTSGMSVRAVTSDSPVPQKEVPLGMWKLLIIDDEAGIRFSIQQIFRSDQCLVLTAENSREALSLFSSESPDVVLLDVRLGTESGFDLLSKIRQLDLKCPVVMITGYGTTDTASEAKKRGAFDCLIKPLDVNLLKQVVDRAVKQHRQMEGTSSSNSGCSNDSQIDPPLGSV